MKKHADADHEDSGCRHFDSEDVDLKESKHWGTGFEFLLGGEGGSPRRSRSIPAEGRRPAVLVNGVNQEELTRSAMKAAKRWIAVDATELVDALDEQRLSEILPKTPGVYVWKRNLRAPAGVLDSPERCLEWVTEIASMPVARLGPRALSHCVSSEGLLLGGGGLTDEKNRVLQRVAVRPKVRKSLVAFIESLTQYEPVPKVGPLPA